MTNIFSRTIWYALQDAAASLGVRLTAVLGGTLDQSRELAPAQRVYDLLDPSNFEGAILFTGALSWRSALGTLDDFLGHRGSLPLVSLGVALEGVSSVAIDQADAVRRLVFHLAEVHGHRRLAFVSGPADQLEVRQRLGAFCQAATELGLGPEDVEVFPGDYSRNAGAAAVRSLAARWTKPGAVVCVNDETAIGALEECRQLGIRVPGQMAIVGFDDTELAPLQEPSLTSAGQPFLWLARRSLELLLRQLDGFAEVVHEIVPAAASYRASCGCLPKSYTPPRDKADLLVQLAETQANTTESFRDFALDWVSDYLTAFEYLLETGNPLVLKSLWSRYYARLDVEQEKGIPFRLLFAGLKAFYGTHPSYDAASQENLMIAGTAEARKRIFDDQRNRSFLFRFQAAELAIGQVTDRQGLSELPFTGLQAVGVRQVALVRFGQPPTVVFLGPRRDHLAAVGTEVEYPSLLPRGLTGPDPRDQQIVAALTAEGTYLGYAVFWVGSTESYVADLLASQFAGALHRIELLERLREQSETLARALDDSRRMQEQLVETEKVASLGRLVAGVAHEINTPLGTGITGASFLLDRLTDVRAQLEAGSLSKSVLEQFLGQGKDALEGVLRNLMRAGELVQAFKGLGLDHGQGEWRPVDLRNLLEDLVLVYAGAFTKRRIDLRTEGPLPGTLVYSQPSALIQVLGELLENAMEHAFPPDFPGEHQVVVQVGLEGELLRLAVTDNGRGLDADERRHLFDPLFTTKRPQGHAGLGLHLTYQLISRTLGGRMTVASEPGSGSCFLCLIPLKQG